MRRLRNCLFSRKYHSANYVIYSKLFLFGAPSHRAFAHSSPWPGQLGARPHLFRRRSTWLYETDKRRNGERNLSRRDGITKQSSEGVRNARQAFQDSFRCLHLPGHFISSLGRVMHVPELCKMHNQAFKYTPSEWTMCTHVQNVHTWVRCCVMHRREIICAQTQNAYYC